MGGGGGGGVIQDIIAVPKAAVTGITTAVKDVAQVPGDLVHGEIAKAGGDIASAAYQGGAGVIVNQGKALANIATNPGDLTAVAAIGAGAVGLSAITGAIGSGASPAQLSSGGQPSGGGGGGGGGATFIQAAPNVQPAQPSPAVPMLALASLFLLRR